MTDLIEKLRDVLTVRSLAHETHLKAEQVRKIDELTEMYLEALINA